ncbi:MAG: hypothetical protein A2167_01825 [Planctomycetes bacterium RBG_13_46_10]|nr:MAG: hypothetical protein A2167_01825 [Planctomycetes bacterium RBG_13_46_10]QBM02887.1 hypothetical protein [uncultured archaeon]
MSKRPINLLLNDILESIDKVEQYTKEMTFDEFSNDQKSIDAVVRNLEIIGEVANRLPDDFKEEHSNVEWYKVVGLRNRIIHEYFGIDLQIIWQIVHADLSSLRQTLSQI